MSSTYIQLQEEEEQKDYLQTNNQRLFVVGDIRNNEIELTTGLKGIISNNSHCEKCGFPLEIKQVNGERRNTDLIKEKRECFVCRRVKILNAILLISYFITAALFITSFVAVIYDALTLDLCLMFGCLEIIFLLFFGRFLEEAIYFGLPQSQRVIAAFYQFANSGDIQGYDIAYRYLQKIDRSKLSSDFYLGLYHVLLFQTSNIPFYFFDDISTILKMPVSGFISKIITEVVNNIDSYYFEKMIDKAPPIGLSLTTTLFMKSKHYKPSNYISNRITTELEKEKLDVNWLKEFYINKDVYVQASNLFSIIDLKEKINARLEHFTPPKVPSIDVIQGSKKLMSNPLVRYLIRIAFYIALVFLIGLVYQLINKL